MTRYGIFTAEFVFGALVLVLLLRFYLSSGPYENTTRISIAINQLTNWLIRPLARFIPRAWGLELATLLVALVTTCTQDIIVLSLRGIKLFALLEVSLPVIIVRGLLTLLILSTQLFTAVIIAGVIISWLRLHGPMPAALGYYCGRLLWPFRKFIQPLAGIDLSPVVALFFAQLTLLAAYDARNTASAIFT